jgi:hypothetical protein
MKWNKEFHVHVDASSIALGAMLSQPGEGDIDHPIVFSSRKLSTSENNYTTTEGRIGNGLCTTKVQALLIGVPLQDVYRPFCLKVLSQ